MKYEDNFMFEYELLTKWDWVLVVAVSTLVALLLAAGVYWLVT
ncbi:MULTISPECIES: hypothetical protein [unclassified Bradyrhizobium]